MCTVTWIREHDGYSLFCNRDERNSRRPAHGPQIRELRGVQYIAPVDGDFGGSWIGVNQFGLTLCLLNRYGDTRVADTREYISRGLLLVDLLDCRNTHQAISRINEFDFTRFPPFDLLALACDAEPILCEWTGSLYTVAKHVESRLPLTSTSLVDPEIALARTAQFRSLLAGGEPTRMLVDQFHRSHAPARGATSVCMHREHASTVSLSKVLVTKSEIVFEYVPGAPCETTSVQRVELNLTVN